MAVMALPANTSQGGDTVAYALDAMNSPDRISKYVERLLDGG